METIQWGRQFLTGITEVDVQHESLVDMVNIFGEALAGNTLNSELLNRLFTDLTTYAQVHFDTEETVMATRGIDPRHIREHVREHRTFVAEINQMAGDIDQADPDDYQQLFDYLIHWLAYHILGMDKIMVRQADDISAGMKPEEAYLREEKRESDAEPFLKAITGLFTLVLKKNRELQEMNRTLEQRVSYRTRELLAANKALEVLSVTDSLTQLPNRRFAMRQLKLLFQEAEHSAQPLACLMVDADNFKTINDTYGHDAGDVVLQRLSKELHDAVRTDDLVCRLGGDEFLIICPNTDYKGAMHLAKQVSGKVRELTVSAGSGYWEGSVSIGVAGTGGNVNGMDALIKAADSAVYIAKKDGRNCVRGAEG